VLLVPRGNLRTIGSDTVDRGSDMFLNNAAKEALIGIVDWYSEVNYNGRVTVDDLARLKVYVDLSHEVLVTNKELMGKEHDSEQQASFDFV
tara:strand:+ start:857 stop:1129 length:273 start_codon:yes stop_codon:yes gene_type:complete